MCLMMITNADGDSKCWHIAPYRGIWDTIKTEFANKHSFLLVITSCYFLLAVTAFEAPPLFSVSVWKEAPGSCSAIGEAPGGMKWKGVIPSLFPTRWQRNRQEAVQVSWWRSKWRLSVNCVAGWKRRRLAPVTRPVCPRVPPYPGAIGHWPISACKLLITPPQHNF